MLNQSQDQPEVVDLTHFDASGSNTIEGETTIRFQNPSTGEVTYKTYPTTEKLIAQIDQHIETKSSRKES